MLLFSSAHFFLVEKRNIVALTKLSFYGHQVKKLAYGASYEYFRSGMMRTRFFEVASPAPTGQK